MKSIVKAHSLTGRITPQTVFAAWLAVKRNRGAAGIDKVSISMFEKNLDANLDSLMRQLKTGSFQPMPARRVYIPKAPGKFRPLGIPAVRDRVAQESCSENAGALPRGSDSYGVARCKKDARR